MSTEDPAADSTKDSLYYSSYFDLSVHKLMLDDEPRTEAYRDAILANKEAFEGKVVMGRYRCKLVIINPSMITKIAHPQTSGLAREYSRSFA